jgi:hypothetical protein
MIAFNRRRYDLFSVIEAVRVAVVDARSKMHDYQMAASEDDLDRRGKVARRVRARGGYVVDSVLTVLIVCPVVVSLGLALVCGVVQLPLRCMVYALQRIGCVVLYRPARPGEKGI